MFTRITGVGGSGRPEPPGSGSPPEPPAGTPQASAPPVFPVAPAFRARRRRRVWWLLAIPLGLGLAVLWHFDPARYGLYPRCTFHELTGWQCPGCGGLRATHALLHGRWGESWRYNPLPLLALPLVLACVATLGWYRLRGRDVPWSRVSALVWVAMAALVLFGLLRNLI